MLFGIDSIDRPVLLTWALRTSDIDASIDRARGLGYDPGSARSMSRRTDGGAVLEWRLTPDTGDGGVGVVPFLIDWARTPHPTTRLGSRAGLRALSATVPDPGEVERRLTALGVSLPLSAGARPRLSAVLATPRGELVID